MDWTLAIDRHREALRRVVALIAAMAGLRQSALGGRQSGTSSPSAADAGRESDRRVPTADCLTLPRRLHRAVLRLVRPAEAAARRLIVVAARGMTLPPLPPRREKPVPEILPKGSAATGLVSTGIPVHRLGLANLAQPLPKRPRNPFRPLPLLDTLRGLPRRQVVRRGPVRSVPRIGLSGRTAFAGPPPSPCDPVDATRLGLRLAAIAAVLDDLPHHAMRLARWRRRRDAVRARGKAHRLGPLRPGRPPGSRRRPDHEVHAVLSDLQGLAVWAREAPDTS